MYNLEICIRTLVEEFLENLLEPKRMQVFPIKLQYQKVLNDLFKKKSVKAYEIHLMSNSTVRSTLGA